jgi:prophage antirepressor-like protein
VSEIERFDFDGLDESALGFHPEHGPLVHETKFFAWIGYDVTHKARIEKDNLQSGDVVRGVFSPLGRETRGGRKADALTKRGVRRILFRSNHPRAVEYADQVLDMLDELDRTGMVVDEKRITDEQIEQGKQRLDNLAVRRLEEKQDYRSILHSLKLGGAVVDEYRFVQNTIYISLFGKTAQQIRATQEQRTGVLRKRGEGFRKSTVAKDFLTEPQLALLNSVVLATIAQIQLRHPDGATAAQMVDAIHKAISIIRPHRIGA